MSKFKLFTVVFALASLLVLSGCSQSAQQPSGGDQQKDPAPQQAQGKYQDGIYFAIEDWKEDSAWRYAVTLEVKDGKIVKADWNGVQKTGGPDKDSLSASGQYGLVAKGGAQAEWHEQAAKAEAYLIDKQDPKAITYTDDEGHTDDIAGVSIHVVEFFDLVEKALANGPVQKGPYKDGAYYAEDEFFSGDWKYFASLTVINGNIVAADWNGINLKNGKDKDSMSKDGSYPMNGNNGKWHEQAARAEAYLLEKQDPEAITYTDDAGHTDDIAGVSIHVVEFFDLAKKALDNGPVAQGPYKDGIYYAADDEFSNGWKYVATVVVKNGSIVGADWNGLPEDEAAKGKDEQSINGDYAMNGPNGKWHEQAQKAEAYLLEKQDPAKITYNDDAGHTDDIAGVSIHVIEFFDLAAKALEGAK